MSKLLLIVRDAELEATPEELNAAPTPDMTSSSARSIEYFVNHEQSQQEQCDTICNLNTVSSSTGLGGMHLLTFRVDTACCHETETFLRRGGINIQRESKKPTEATLDEEVRRLMQELGASKGATSS
ncbi:hypothetical protein SUGI_0324340 [Cryptomeria japonica]|nr:hypothetical protein SUGI_0324340 [Cryptomeria japonica]